MRYSEIFKEAKRLHDMGLAIHWLHARSKRPIESGWTTGPRKEWSYLAETYTNDLNLGVRTGTPSKLKNGYLAIVDVDVKSKAPHHLNEVNAALSEILGDYSEMASVASGRGNGSRHYYCRTKLPFKTFNPAASADIIKVLIPSKKPSKKELEQLTSREIEDGWRLSKAWEISLYSDGRQVVLPPSVHPDSGELYRWKKHLTSVKDLPILEFDTIIVDDPHSPSTKAQRDSYESFVNAGAPTREAGQATERSEVAALDFQVSPVELSWLPISDDVRDAIVDGKGVEDRSGYLLKASSALISAGLDQNEVLSVLTDPETFLGACAYEHAKTKDRGRAAAWVYRYTVRKVSAERSAVGIFGPAKDVKKLPRLTQEEIDEQTEELLAGWDWRREIIRVGNGIPQKLVQNVVTIISNAVGEDVIRRDEFAYRDAYSYDTPWGGKKGDHVSDDDVQTIKYWLGSEWGFEPADNVISGALVVMAKQNAFDPVRNLLEALPEWDRVPRLDTWLADNFEAKGDPEYLAQVFRKWMVAMVMRVYQPGAKFDWMPIFEGAQGIGKSSFGRLLVGDKYFLDWLPNLNDKDSALSLQGMWGVEMGELSQFRRNELENIKAFITRTVDKLRPPYGRRLIESPRRCVFFGTTNRSTYLTDETGNRRFKPVVVGNLNFDALAKDRIQLFAEARALWIEKMETERTMELTGMAKIFERQIHAEKMVEDDSNAMSEMMEQFLEKVASGRVNFDLEKFRVSELFEGVGPLQKWKPENRNLQFAAKMLIRLGGQNRKIRGSKYWNMPISDENHDFSKPPTHPTFM
jgi:predicted P-loop ATPase